MTVGSGMKNPYIIPSLIIAAAILGGFWVLKQPTNKAPSISIHDAAAAGDNEAVKQHLADGWDVNAKDYGLTPFNEAITVIFA